MKDRLIEGEVETRGSVLRESDERCGLSLQIISTRWQFVFHIENLVDKLHHAAPFNSFQRGSDSRSLGVDIHP